MKTASNPMKAHLQQDCMTIALLYKITRADGQIFSFTDHDRDIVYGGFTYEAAVGFSPTATQNKSDLSVDNQEATAFIDSDSIKENELRFGIWDAATVEIRLVNWADLSQGEVKIRKGSLGNISMKNGVMTAEILGLNNKLQILLGRSYGAPCDAELGDSRCQATVPVESGTVSSSADAHHLTPNAGLTGAAGFYNDGIVSFTSGVNSGLTFQIGTWDGTTLQLKSALFAAPTAGDAFTISPGCAHTTTDCRVKFSNLVNHRGFPAIPGQDAVLITPDAT